jgi:hypothetical protein
MKPLITADERYLLKAESKGRVLPIKRWREIFFRTGLPLACGGFGQLELRFAVTLLNGLFATKKRGVKAKKWE